MTCIELKPFVTAFDGSSDGCEQHHTDVSHQYEKREDKEKEIERKEKKKNDERGRTL